MFKKLLKWGLLASLGVLLLGVGTIAVIYWRLAPTLPNVEEIRKVKLEQPLKVYSADGKLIASFGETRRTPVKIAQIPKSLREAFIAVEDARFFEHPGVDWQGLVRAGWDLVRRGGEKGVGGSTITQQLTRNIFLSNERTFERKMREIFLALKIERELSKDEILELYLNKIFLGHRAYGVAAAAEVYYGKTLAELSLAEGAMLAGLPKAPSKLNPIIDPKGALERRNHVLERMAEEGFISAEDAAAARQEPDLAYLHSPPTEVDAQYIAEMVRIEAEKRLGPTVLNDGYQIYTTVESRLQAAANQAVVHKLQDYDRRHGWRGAEARIAVEGADAAAIDAQLQAYWNVNGLIPGVVTVVEAERALVHLNDGQDVELALAGMKWARRYNTPNSRGPEPKKVEQVLAVGDVVRVRRTEEGGFELAQIPRVQGAVVALDPENGAIRALVGGFHFGLNKFNRATQSMRQPGSSFKPFVYSAALEHGFTTASIINDAPLVFEDVSSADGMWRPQNDNEKFNGPTRLREAMVTSRNLVSVRVLDAIGVRTAREYIQRFGFAPETLPENLSMALGTSAAPPLAMARGYAAFANGGFLVEPHLIDRILDAQGKEVYRTAAALACRSCPERLELELQAQELAAQQALASQSSAPEAPPVAAGDPGIATTSGVPESAPSPVTGIAGMDPVVAAEKEVSTINGVHLAKRAIDTRNAYIITSMMLDVVKRGTGRPALELGRTDLAGKTGTTNEHRDAWFSGFNAQYVATAWVGFDDFSSLGEGEFGGKAALPMWMDFMRVATSETTPQLLPQPPGVTTARINPNSGLLTTAGDPAAIMELFRVEDLGKLGTAISAGDRLSNQDAYDVF